MHIPLPCRGFLRRLVTFSCVPSGNVISQELPKGEIIPPCSRTDFSRPPLILGNTACICLTFLPRMAGLLQDSKRGAISETHKNSLVCMLRRHCLCLSLCNSQQPCRDRGKRARMPLCADGLAAQHVEREEIVDNPGMDALLIQPSDDAPGRCFHVLSSSTRDG